MNNLLEILHLEKVKNTDNNKKIKNLKSKLEILQTNYDNLEKESCILKNKFDTMKSLFS